MTEALVIGAGPAGLMAAEQLAKSGADVLVVESKPSVGRKFLMAGKSGLNLTKQEPLADFLRAYGDSQDWIEPMIRAFGPEHVQAFAEGLDQALFTGSTRRVFPKAMKASPLLRAWLARLDELGVERRTNWRWTGWKSDGHAFETSEGQTIVRPKVAVFAMGGASWPKLGSTGGWREPFSRQGVAIAPFAAQTQAYACLGARICKAILARP